VSTRSADSQSGDALQLTFPALYTCADKAAIEHQKSFLRLLRCEYALLLLAAIFSVGFSKAPWYFALYAVVFVGTILCLIYRSTKKPEQDWYKCRALAESVKTSTWRYAMKTEPFLADSANDARSAFRKYLADVLASNQHIGEKIAGAKADGAQTTSEMDQVRSLTWSERRELYLAHRIKDQRTWYSNKAVWNKSMSDRWVCASFAVYTAALVLVISHVAFPDWPYLPIEPLIVLASVFLGWTQIKKFSELASVYTLTAHEIGLIEGKLSDVDSEKSSGSL
jgi:hypothetical protein